MIVGADVISQQNADIKNANETAIIYSGILTLNYKFTPKVGVYARGELFNDDNGFLSGTFKDVTGNLTGLIVKGFTLGAEYKPTENSYIRIEGRELITDDAQKIFYRDGNYSNTRTEVMANVGVWF